MKDGIWLLINAIYWIISQIFQDNIMGKVNEWIETTGCYKNLLAYMVSNPWLIPSTSTAILGLYIIMRSLRAKQKSVVIPIPNRDVLFRAIAKVQQTSADLLIAQERLDNLDMRSPNLVHVDEMTTRDNTLAEFKKALNKLEAEKMVAGKVFDALLAELIAYISTQVMAKLDKPTGIRILTALRYSGHIANKIREVTQKIDEISGQAPDKEGSHP